MNPLISEEEIGSETLPGLIMGKEETDVVVDKVSRRHGIEKSQYRRLAGQGKGECDAKGHPVGVIGVGRGERRGLRTELSMDSNDKIPRGFDVGGCRRLTVRHIA